ncbi:hypothetical protein EVAR_97192_1 [Eumeta japonica]|uniref:Uncharacterized protein n=1 Tax=Eumeta variegata TaxID=151549 RepID=A0A4C1WGA8_EUMVA|nr:hypothetical protein EVAR_97192_1 [Eumeta japonica]
MSDRELLKQSSFRSGNSASDHRRRGRHVLIRVPEYKRDRHAIFKHLDEVRLEPHHELQFLTATSQHIPIRDIVGDSIIELDFIKRHNFKVDMKHDPLKLEDMDSRMKSEISGQEVVEIRDSGGGFIHGKVTPQTRVNNRPYDVKVEEHLIDCNATYTFNDVQNVPYCTEGSLFGQYIQSEKDIEPLREIAREEEEKGKKKRI